MTELKPKLKIIWKVIQAICIGVCAIQMLILFTTGHVII